MHHFLSHREKIYMSRSPWRISPSLITLILVHGSERHFCYSLYHQAQPKLIPPYLLEFKEEHIYNIIIQNTLHAAKTKRDKVTQNSPAT